MVPSEAKEFGSDPESDLSAYLGLGDFLGLLLSDSLGHMVDIKLCYY